MAFGNLKFDTLTTSDAKNTNTEKSLDTSYIFNGVAKNWLSATEPGSVGDSFNTSTTTDGGSGIHTITLTNNMASTAHAAVTGMQDADMACLGESGRATTGYMVTLLQRADSLTRTDGDHFSALFGDLA